MADLIGDLLDFVGLDSLTERPTTTVTDPYSQWLAGEYQNLKPYFFEQTNPNYTGYGQPFGGQPSLYNDVFPQIGQGLNSAWNWAQANPYFPDTGDGGSSGMPSRRLPGGAFPYDGPNMNYLHQPIADPSGQFDYTGSGTGPTYGAFLQQPTYDPNSAFGRAMMSSLGGNAVNAEDWGMLQGQDVEDYFQSTMYDPAMRQYQNEILPQLREGAGNLHSSYRQNLEAKTLGDLSSNLNAQRGNLQYENLLRNQQLRQAASGSNLQAQMNAMGMSAQYDPRLQYLNMLSGQGQPTSQVIQGPSTLDTLGGLAGTAALLGLAFA